MKIINKIYFTVFILCLLNFNAQSQTLSWVETGPNPGTVLTWNTSAISSDGSKMIAGVYNGRLYLSTNYGATWSETGPAPGNDFKWQDIAMSGNGLNIVVIIDFGYMYVTTDGGQNWQMPYDLEYITYRWTTVSMSESGEKVIVGINSQAEYNGGLILQALCSDNGGLTFYDAFRNSNGHSWTCSAVSGNGNIIILGAYRWNTYIHYPGVFRRTTNGSGSWEPMVVPTGQYWNTCAMSSDGTRIIIGSSEKLFISSNSGSSWTEVRPAGDQALDWSTTSMSADGMKIIAGVYVGRLYISTDGGINWDETRPGGYDYNAPWNSARVSSDGNKLLATVRGGRIWSNEGIFPVEIVSFNANYSEGIITLHWQTATEVNNYGFEVERCEKQEARSVTWKTVGFVAGHGNSNSVKEYLFVDESVSGGKYSYRLKQIDNDGSFSYSDEIIVETLHVMSLPTEYALYQNYPNPFNPVTTIKYSIPSNVNGETSNTKLLIFDVLGNEVAVLVNEPKSPGNYEVQFEANKYGLSSGVYFYRISTDGFTSTKKLVLMK